MLAWMSKRQPSTPVAHPSSNFIPKMILCLRIPADGTRPQLIQRETLYINNEKHADCFLYHIPDVRMFWNAPEPGQNIWNARTVRRVDVSEQPNERVNGYYYFFRCCHEHLPRNPYFSKASGVKGDVFVVKVEAAGGWTDPVKYVDVPSDLLEDKKGRYSLRLMMNAYASE